MSKFGVSLCNESTLNSKLDNFVSGGIVYFDKTATDNNVLANVSMSDSNVSTPSTSASKTCDLSCKCESVGNNNKRKKFGNSSAKIIDN